MIPPLPARSFLVSFLAVALAIALAGGRAAAQPAPAKEAATGVEAYRLFALQRDGDAPRGRTLFADEKRLGCTKCHSTDGKGGKVGPDLFSAGDQFSRRDLIEAVLRPSATIAVGYATTVVTTRAAAEHQGVLKQATDDWIELAGADSQRVRIPRRDIESQVGSDVSLMPEGLQSGLSMPEFADLIEYLVTLKQPDTARTSHRGMPGTIPQLTRPVVLRPFLAAELRFPAAKAPPTQHVQSGLVWFGQIPGRPGAYLAADQAGLVWRIEKTEAGERTTVFADLTTDVFSARGPNGLLGVAFHPRFRDNRKYYLKHQVLEAGHIATVLVERQFAPDLATDSGQPSRRLLTIPAVAEHHNGGCIQFGPDGFLYLGMGDSAPNHDPQGHGQDLRRLLGKMLRIDVDHRDAGLAYAIPPDNPFRDHAEARPEIWAWGLREPWRFAFDRATGDLWVGDLGQERGDEVSIVRRGENHGWNVYEGFEVFSREHRKEGVVYVPPVFATRRKQGTTMVGGFVYRGKPGPSFRGVYVFGDYTSKRIWGLTQTDRSLDTVRELATSPQAITAFAEDEVGNLYAVGQAGMVYRLEFDDARFEGGHGFAGADYSRGKVFVADARGRVTWEYPAPACDELWALPGGNLLFTTGHGVKEVTTDGKVVFRYESKSEIYACQRLPDGNTFVGECNAGRLLELTPSGAIAKEIRLLPEGTDGGHLYMRNARRLPDGHYLVAHYGAQVVREYDAHGKTVREIPAASGPHSVVRLPDGHTLVACGDLVKDGARVFEVDAAGKTVWEIGSRDLPGIRLKVMTGLQRLPNGNTVLSNWQGHESTRGEPHAIEVTPDKRVVWVFDDREAADTVSSIQLLDVPGDATRGGIWH